MGNILTSFKQSLTALARPRMALLIFTPPLISFFGLFIVFVIFWASWLTGLTSAFSSIGVIQWISEFTNFQGLAYWCALIFLILTFLPAAYILAVLMTSIFVMPVVLKWVGDIDYPHLEKKRGGSLVGSLWNTLFTTGLFIFAFIVTLPLWLLPGLQILIPLFLTAWLNKRIFLYDVLQDYASDSERRRIEKQERGSLYAMGLLLGLLSYVPLAFFFVPVLLALSYTYYCLNALQALRKAET